MALLHDGAHSREGWWSKRSKKTRLAIVLTGLLSISAVAIALFFLTVGITGTVTGASYAVNVEAISAGFEDCATVDVPNNEVDIAFNDAVIDDVCNIRAEFGAAAGNSGIMQLQDFVVPAGLDVTMTSTSCGRVLAPGATAQVGSVNITFNGSVSSITFNPATEGYIFVRAADFNAANCPPT